MSETPAPEEGKKTKASKKNARTAIGVAMAVAVIFAGGAYAIGTTGILKPSASTEKMAALAPETPMASIHHEAPKITAPVETGETKHAADAKGNLPEKDNSVPSAAKTPENAPDTAEDGAHEMAAHNDEAPALTIDGITIEPVEALERGTYKVTGSLSNPGEKKIELTAIRGLLKDKDGGTVDEVLFDLPAKRIMAPGEKQDFSYTVVAAEPGIVRLEVAVDLLR